MKKIYWGFSESAYGVIFVDENFKFIHYVHDNDMGFRAEYMTPLFTYLQAEMVEVDWEVILKKANRKLENGAVNPDELDYETFMKGKV